MIYTKEQMDEIKKIISVFHSFILSNPHIDLIWSNKVGYVYLSNIIPKSRIIGTEPVIITGPEELCKHLFYDLIYHALSQIDSIYDIPTIPPEEMPSILKLLNPYIQKLPQYRNILEELLGLQIRKERLD